jgi:hypothetical protein
MEERQSSDSPTPANGKGSFWVSKKVVDTLIATATATQVCTYLVLAKHTDATGRYSSAGLTAVKKALGMGDDQARRAIESLNSLTWNVAGRKASASHRLVYKADEWKAKTGEILDRPTVKSQVRFVLEQFSATDDIGDRIWFGNGLVDGYGQFQQPLRRLKRLGDAAARLLLLMYRDHAMEQFGGVPPYLVHEKYEVKDKQYSKDGYRLWHAEHGGQTSYLDATLPILRLQSLSRNSDEKKSQLEPFWGALEALKATGFIYEVVTVLDGEPGRDTNAVYELDARTRHGYKAKGEEGLGGDTARLAGYWGAPVTDAGGRFNGTYAVLVERGVRPVVAGIYRLRFRVANPKNYTVTSAFQRIRQGQLEWQQILKGLLAPYATISAASEQGRTATASSDNPF